jgi:hypothetical protein
LQHRSGKRQQQSIANWSIGRIVRRERSRTTGGTVGHSNGRYSARRRRAQPDGDPLANRRAAGPVAAHFSHRLGADRGDTQPNVAEFGDWQQRRLSEQAVDEPLDLDAFDRLLTDISSRGQCQCDEEV